MAKITREFFGCLSNGKRTELFTLTNQKGVKAAFTDYGAAMVQMIVPDRNGKWEDVVLGYDRAKDYEQNDRCAGATCGRVAARLAGGEFYLGGIKYETSRNEKGIHTLHGGFEGFDRKLWQGEILEDKVQFTYVSPNGEEGFPGTLHIRVICSLSEENEVTIAYEAESDRDTVVNLTNHIYFNLKGHGSGSILRHRLQIFSDFYAPCDGTPMPDGQILRVQGTPMDFRLPAGIGQRMETGFEQLSVLEGFNHDFVLNKKERGSLEAAGAVWENTSGRKLEVFTTKPSLHFFTANNLTRRRGKEHAVYDIHGGFCMEPGFLPNSMEFLHFPSPILKAGEAYRHKTSFKFSVISSDSAE